MKPKHSDGLVLNGTIVASRIESGLTRDDGKPWKARINTVTNGQRVFNYRESGLDPTQDYEPLQLGDRIAIDVEYANTQNGLTTIGGTVLTSEANGSSAATSTKSNG